MKPAVTVPTGDVVGIGKLKVFPTKEFPHEIPTLSFLVAKAEDGRFVASCLQMLIDGEGDSEEDAIKSMERGCVGYLDTIFASKKTNPWEVLLELFTEPLGDYWNAYKTMQINFAKKGISTSLQTVLEKKIRQLEDELDKYKNNKLPPSKVVSYQKKVA